MLNRICGIFFRYSLVVLAAIALPAQAATFTVNSALDGDDATPRGNGTCSTNKLVPALGVCTLRAAIEEANALAGSDIIQFASGLGTIAPGSNLPAITDPVTINGFPITTTASGFAGGQTISGGGLVSLFRIVAPSSGPAPDPNTYSISGLTITGGKSADNGGGILFNPALNADSGSTLQLANVVLTANHADSGFGGALGVGPGNTVILSGTTALPASIFGNFASDGGAIAVRSGTLTINGPVSITGNKATGNGGAVFADSAPPLGIPSPASPGSAATLNIVGATFSGNSAAGNGGAVEILHGRLTLTNSTLDTNTATGDGGAFHIGPGVGTDGVVLSNCTIYKNKAAHGGAVGASASAAAASSLVNCTIASNTATAVGGGDGFSSDAAHTFPGNSAFPFTSSIISNELPTPAGSNKDCASPMPLMDVGSTGSNLSSDFSCGFSAANHDLVGVDPLLDPAGLVNHGGSTKTVALTALSTSATSPAINASQSLRATLTDQRGAPTADGLATDAFTGCKQGADFRRDIGAYEYAGFGAIEYAPNNLFAGFPVGIFGVYQDEMNAQIDICRFGDTTMPSSANYTTLDTTFGSGKDAIANTDPGAPPFDYTTTCSPPSTPPSTTCSGQTLRWDANNSTNQFFLVPVVSHDTTGSAPKPEKFFKVSILTPTNPLTSFGIPQGADLGPLSTGFVVIRDKGTLQFAKASDNFSETDSGTTGGNANVAKLDVTRKSDATRSTFVQCQTVDGTAMAGVNYTATTQTLNWGAGDTSTRQCLVQLIHDGAHTGDLQFTVQLQGIDARGARLGTPSTETVTIADVDPPSAGSAQFTTSGQPLVKMGPSNDFTENIPVTRTCTNKCTGAVSVHYHFGAANDTAGFGTDYTGTQDGTLTFADGVQSPDTSQSVPVTIFHSATPAPNKQFTVTLTNPLNGIAIGSPNPTMQPIQYLAGFKMDVSPSSLDLTEGGAPQTYTISLGAKPDSNVTVTITSSSPAVNLSSSSVTFTPSNFAPKTITVTAVNNTAVDGDRTATLTNTASGDPNYAGQVKLVTATVHDNDSTVEFVNPPYAVNEGQDIAIPVDRQGTGTGAVTVKVNLANGTAQSGVNYTNTSCTLTWNDGETGTTKNCVVRSIHDNVATGDRTVNLSLSMVGNSNGAATTGLGTPNTAVLTIHDLDQAGVTASKYSAAVTEGKVNDSYTVVLNSAPTANVTVKITPASSDVVVSPSTLTFTSANYATPQTVTVSAPDNNQVDSPNPRTVNLNNAATSSDPNYNGPSFIVATAVTDIDSAVQFTQAAYSVSENAGSATINVARVGSNIGAITVNYTASDGSAKAGTNYTATSGQLNWADGDNATKSFTVPVLDDQQVQPTLSASLSLTSPSNTTGHTLIGTPGTSALNITNTDVAGVSVIESGGSTNVTEGAAADSYMVVLNSKPAGNVVITLAHDGQLATSANTLTFTPQNYNAAQTVTVSAPHDNIAQGNRTDTITQSASSSDAIYNGIPVNNVVVNITDVDVAGVTVVETGGSTQVTEGGAADSYTVALTTQPTATVTVSLAHNAQITTSVDSLTFTPANYNVPQAVMVSAPQDNIAEGNRTLPITQTASSADVHYNNIGVRTVNVQVTDIDTAGVLVSKAQAAVTEGGAGDSYLVALTSQPVSNVTITVNGGPQLAVTPATLTFTPANYNTAQTVNISAVDDTVAQGTRTVQITQSAASSDSNYNGIAVGGVAVTITDNDFSDHATINDVNGRPVTFTTSTGSFSNLKLVPVPSGASTDYTYPNGFFSYQIVGVTHGATATVTITLAPGSAPTNYVKCGVASCSVLPGTSVNGDVLTLSLTDGGTGDNDGAIDGVITDPGAPAHVKVAPRVESSGGGALSWLSLAGLTLMLLMRRRFING